MQLRPTIKPRERILSFGVGGTGKSVALLSIARRCPNDTFHVLDNDDSFERLLATDYQDVQEVGNVRVWPMYEWADYVPMLRTLRDEVDVDDWVALDSMTKTWDEVSDWFIDQIHGKDIASYFLDVRRAKEQGKRSEGKDSKSLGAIEGWMDWPVINKQYFTLYTELLRLPCHTYMTAEQTKISDEDDKEVKGLFGPYGVKPKGQKRLGYIPHTVLMTTKTRVGEYQLTTIKDRGRVELESEPIEDFGKDYLMKVAKWRPVRMPARGGDADKSD